MFNTGVLFLLMLGYLFVLFFVAYYAEKKEQGGKSLVSNPYIYSLSLAVYCSSWTFYGSVGKAANTGLVFLTIYIGPTLMATLWWIVLRKIIHISKENRITTISDFISTRYGKSILLSALVTLVAVVGITPYLGLQLKAIMTTFSILSGRTDASNYVGVVITLIIGIFAIMFGARRLDASERHVGLVFAIAFESAVKLISFVAVGVYVTYGLFNGFADIFGQMSASTLESHMTLGEGSHTGYAEWTSLTLLSMMAIMFLPRQFHVAVVENSDVEHIKKAMWLFPFYLFLINIFVLPIAYGGLLLGGSVESADFFVLDIPLKQGRMMLALFAFIGGFSAATAMVIVESLALSTMVMNSLVTPALFRMNAMKGFHQMILNIKRLVIIGLVFLGYFFAIRIGEFYSLVSIGLKSFEAVTIFAPSMLLGLYWKGGNKNGAIAGILAGFAVWIYTLMIPAFARAGIIEPGGLLFGSRLLNPTALFGLAGLDRWTHSLFYGLSFNLFFYVSVSMFTRQSELDVKQAMVFVDSYSPGRLQPGRRPKGIKEVEELLLSYLGPFEAALTVENFLRKNRLSRENLTEESLVKLRDEAEMALSGALGPAISALVLEDRMLITHQERRQISDSFKHFSKSLQFSRQELAEANRQLALLKEFSENVIESIPLGVATLDEHMRVKSWNMAMERIIGITRHESLGMQAELLFKCLDPNIFDLSLMEGEFACKRVSEPYLTLKGYLSKLAGGQKGYVLVFEDITEKKKIEEELFRTNKYAGIGRLAAGVSHEIGNPLASIFSLVQEIAEQDNPPFTTESLSVISQQVERITRIMRSLGDFARLSPRHKTESDLSGILKNTIDFVRFDKGYKIIDIRPALDDVPRLKVDPDQMQQVFLNLMLNARDAMPRGGVLDVSLKRQNNQVVVVFTDTGEGISEELLEKVFDPFFTTKAQSRGTGLGLSICYGIIKDHGGTIDMVSAQGKGTSVIIKLPVVD